MEYWDLYTADRKKLNRRHRRGDRLNPGEYHICIFAWIVNDEDEVVMIRRHPDKTFPLKWDCVGGALLAGEESLDGILREVREETGILLNREDGILIKSGVLEDYIGDVWFFRHNTDLAGTRLQEGETVDIRLVPPEELKIMELNGELPSPMIHDIEFLEMFLKRQPVGS